MKIEGIDYTIEGIESVRKELVGMRDNSMKQWPEAIPVTVLLSHVIALLAYLIDVKKRLEE